MNDQTPPYGTPPENSDVPSGTPSTPTPYGPGVPGAPHYGSAAYGTAVPGTGAPGSYDASFSAPFGPPQPGFGTPLTPPSGVVVPPAVRSAASILRALGIVGLIGGVLGVIGMLALVAMVGVPGAVGVYLVIGSVSVVVGLGLSVAFLVQAPKVRDGDVRAGRVAVVLLGVTIGLRALGLFPFDLSLGTLVNLALIGLSIQAVVKLRSAEAQAYYAAASGADPRR